MTDIDVDVGLPNDRDVTNAWNRICRERLGSPPFLDAVWLPADFQPLPRPRLLSFYNAEFALIGSWCFVSPRVFKLLDTPSGTLQGIPVEVDWIGDAPAGVDYVWVPFIPSFPAIDVDASDCEVQEHVDPTGGPTRRQIRFADRLVLREALHPPFGLFWAAEMVTKLLATDAVAHAVLASGCVDMDFIEVETSSLLVLGSLRRRGLNGVELIPEGVRMREANHIPVPER